MQTQTTEALFQHNEKRTKCLVYTRVMGYHRPVESFNIGKKVNTNNEPTLENVNLDFLNKKPFIFYTLHTVRLSR